jgi:Fe2+ or Zn2+ uptake regulation protein
MKRGRPIIRIEVQERILSILQKHNIPLNIKTISDQIFKEYRKRYSWNTIQKYLNELVEMGQVEGIVLPHSKDKGKPGLKVYIIKK